MYCSLHTFTLETLKGIRFSRTLLSLIPFHDIRLLVRQTDNITRAIFWKKLLSTRLENVDLTLERSDAPIHSLARTQGSKHDRWAVNL